MLSRRGAFRTGRCENGASAGASNLLYYVLRSFEDPVAAMIKYSSPTRLISIRIDRSSVLGW